jgi:hypothetical protein
MARGRKLQRRDSAAAGAPEASENRWFMVMNFNQVRVY